MTSSTIVHTRMLPLGVEDLRYRHVWACGSVCRNPISKVLVWKGLLEGGGAEPTPTSSSSRPGDRPTIHEAYWWGIKPHVVRDLAVQTISTANLVMEPSPAQYKQRHIGMKGMAMASGEYIKHDPQFSLHFCGSCPMSYTDAITFPFNPMCPPLSG